MSTLRTLEQFSPNTWRLGKFPFRRFGFGADSIPMIKGRVTILLNTIWIIGHLYNRKIINSWLMTTYSISLSEESLRFILGKFHTAPGPIFLPYIDTKIRWWWWWELHSSSCRTTTLRYSSSRARTPAPGQSSESVFFCSER